MQTPTARLVIMGVITISNGDYVDSERGGDGLVITISNGDDVATHSERGGDGGDHYQQLR